ncbi:SCO3374 family protein [Streptomyces calvus]|nr:SCO3374 family protein [Streptomyces calvus]
MTPTAPAGVPHPRRPLRHGPLRHGPLPRRPRPADREEVVRRWYEDELGWPTLPGPPVRLAVGVRFDVLDVPEEAGRAALERLRGHGREFPVAAGGGRLRLLVAAGSAEEVPGLLEWLEWDGVPLDLTASGAGASMEAPHVVAAGAGGASGGSSPDEWGGGSQGAAVWLRPPEPGREVEASLPTLSAMATRRALGDRDGPPDLVRLVNTVATQVHRVRLRQVCAAAAVDNQPLAFS